MYAHLEVLAEDMASFGYESVRAFHGIWLQEVEQGRVTWADSTIRDTLRRRFVWNPAIVDYSTTHQPQQPLSPTGHTEAECIKKQVF
jgi:hypothetical protein